MDLGIIMCVSLRLDSKFVSKWIWMCAHSRYPSDCEQEMNRDRTQKNEEITSHWTRRRKKQQKKTKRRIHFHLIRCVDLNTDSLFIDLSLVRYISKSKWRISCILWWMEFLVGSSFIVPSSFPRSTIFAMLTQNETVKKVLDLKLYGKIFRGIDDDHKNNFDLNLQINLILPVFFAPSGDLTFRRDLDNVEHSNLFTAS